MQALESQTGCLRMRVKDTRNSFVSQLASACISAWKIGRNLCLFFLYVARRQKYKHWNPGVPLDTLWHQPEKILSILFYESLACVSLFSAKLHSCLFRWIRSSSPQWGVAPCTRKHGYVKSIYPQHLLNNSSHLRQSHSNSNSWAAPSWQGGADEKKERGAKCSVQALFNLAAPLKQPWMCGTGTKSGVLCRDSGFGSVTGDWVTLACVRQTDDCVSAGGVVLGLPVFWGQVGKTSR